jgi:hypothetical protein
MNIADVDELAAAREQHRVHQEAYFKYASLARENERLAEAHRKIMLGYEELVPDLAKPHLIDDLPENEASHGFPRGIAAVEAIFKEMPDQWMSPAEYFAEMKGRGWVDSHAENPEAAGRAALNRAHKLELVVKRQRDGRTVEYRWTGDDLIAV